MLITVSFLFDDEMFLVWSCKKKSGGNANSNVIVVYSLSFFFFAIGLLPTPFVMDEMLQLDVVTASARHITKPRSQIQ
jgi:hypothetical protein